MTKLGYRTESISDPSFLVQAPSDEHIERDRDLMRLQRELREAKEAARKAKETARSYQEAYAQLVGKKEKAEAELQAVHRLSEKRQKDFQTLKKLASDHDQGVQDQKKKLKRRELRLNRYAESLNRWKKETRNLCIQLSQEIESSKGHHPLQDYLTLTQTELSKLEIQLLKTPVVSKERAELEECVNQLIAQRDFLKETIERANAEWGKRLHYLRSAIDSSDLGPIPPCPPDEMELFAGE